ncbi:MAG: bifunctional oligoribonuclease/PAP phosphatase NrnA [Candidatus Aadella gelida]|nr:bifunctional oligoribonuclease/PAP phosphatase NrnA [Candidatus Aadella gelida]
MKKAVEAIKNAGTITIAAHVNPDGDTIGSMLSLGLGLEKLGKKVYLVSQDGVPKKYRTLPGAKSVKKTITKKTDIAITVDCNSKKMVGEPYKTMRSADNFIEIDHHETREAFGDLRIIDTKATAVGEQIYELLKKLKVTIDKDIAQNILTSLIVETGSFRLPNIRPFTFQVCADLVKRGADFYKLVDMIFWTHSKEAVLLSGIALSRCKFRKNGKIVWSQIKRKDFENIKGKDEDVDAVADEMRAIKKTEIAVFFREKGKSKIRVSLRSKKHINIAHLAEQYGGGGHSDVAGCVIKNDSAEIRGLLYEAEKYLKDEKRYKTYNKRT